MNQKLIEVLFRRLMSEGLGLDMSDPNLKGTPARVAKMYCQEFFSGMDREFPAEALTVFPNDDGYDQIIMQDNIPFVSICGHHFLPFSGKAWFLYIPDQLLPGASKPDRLINHYSCRPQLQERLAKQIMDKFMEVVCPKGAMLVMRAIHGCKVCRGVRSGNHSGMVTSVVTGGFKDNEKTRTEALALIQLSLNDVK